MRDTVHVLVAGWTPPGQTAAALRDARLGVLLDLLAAEQIEVRPWQGMTISIPAVAGARPHEAARAGAGFLDPADLVWPDVILLRASDLAAWVCEICDRVAFDDESIERHMRSTGHAAVRQGALAPPLLVEAIDAQPAILRNRAFVFDIDEGLASVDEAGVAGAEIVLRAARCADVVVASTPGGVRAMEAHSHSVRLLREALDDAWVTRRGTADYAPRAGLTSVALGDVDAVADLAKALVGVVAPPDWLRRGVASVPGVRPIDLPVEIDAAVRLVADQDASIALLNRAGPGDAGSELPWLMAAIAGLPAVASASRPTPYASLEHGRDVLLAKSPDAWRTHVRRLAGSRDLRAELAGHALERARAGYSPAVRAAEWADALEYAAGHAGIARQRQGVRGRRTGPSAAAGPERIPLAEDPAGALAHRRRMRLEGEAAMARLAELRDGRDVCWRPEMPPEPLVSVVIPTYSRGRILTERSLGSVLSQTYTNLDVVVVGDHATPETIEAMASVTDPRVRFVDLPERSPYHPDPFLRWLQVGCRPFNRGLQLARGDFIAPNADDDEFTPDHVERLLSVALEYRLEFVYGDAIMELPDGSWEVVGGWPPREGHICGGAVLFAAPLRFIEMDEECWRDLEPNDWNLWRRMLEAGARAGQLPEIVFRHYAEGREWRAQRGQPAGGQVGESQDALRPAV